MNGDCRLIDERQLVRVFLHRTVVNAKNVRITDVRKLGAAYQAHQKIQSALIRLESAATDLLARLDALEKNPSNDDDKAVAATAIEEANAAVTASLEAEAFVAHEIETAILHAEMAGELVTPETAGPEEAESKEAETEADTNPISPGETEPDTTTPRTALGRKGSI